LPSVEGVSDLFPRSINNRGDIVGTYTTAPPPGAGPKRSFFHDGSAGVARRILDDGSITQTATHINDARQVSAETFDSTSRATPGHRRGVRWQDGTETDIRALPPGPDGPQASAQSINSQGWIAGWSLGVANVQRAVLWDGSTLRDLGSGAREKAFSIALGINASGQVVGQTNFPDLANPDAALFESGTVRDLGSLAGGGGSIALAINDGGRIVGTSPAPNDSFQHAFVFDLPGGPMRDVSPGRPCTLGSVNSSGVAVGSCIADASGAPTKLRGVILRGTVVEDLDGLLGDSRWVLEDAASINDKGQIAGFGLHDGNFRAFVLTPR
jgi:probable HAF family extracellular repeat protein